MAQDTRKHLAYHFLKDAILEQKYSPGQALLEETIATELGISRTPVREAIRELSREGLVETSPNRRAVVRALTTLELLDIFEIKIRLEGLCAAHAAERSAKATAQELAKTVKAMAAAAKAHDKQAYLRADEAFHAAIYLGAKNDRVQEIINDLNAQWHRMRQGMAAIESRMETAVDEHQRIAQAIGAGDPQAAESAMRVHLENLRDQIRSMLEDFVRPLGGVA
ncbi:MAG: GntR family transcriptional regulator [Chloroflexi bacterium]|nr:GntR family transcriptional regulator [Chloroflexota bacterium]